MLLGELLSRIKLKRMGYKHGMISMCVQHLWDFYGPRIRSTDILKYCVGCQIVTGYFFVTNYSYCSGLEIVKRQDEFCVHFRVYVMPLLLISGCITGNHRNKPDPLEYYYTIFHTVNGKENGVIS